MTIETMYTSPSTQKREKLNEIALQMGLAISKWETASRHNPNVRRTTYVVHLSEKARARRAAEQEGARVILSVNATEYKSTTKRSKLWKTLEQIETYLCAVADTIYIENKKEA